MRSNFIRTFIFLGIFLPGFTAFSQDGIPDKPQPQRLVNDYANILSPTEVNALEQKLVHFNDSTSTQIVVVIINDLQGYDATDFADRLGEKWGVGQKGKDNGIVILIKPTGGQGQRKIRISVGYGLEGVIPDATARKIVDNEMIPHFKNNQFYKGIDAALNILISLSKGEFTADQYNKRASKKSTFVTLIPLFIVIIIFILIIRNNKRKGPMSPGKSLPFWMLLGMMGSGRSSSGSWGGFSGGGGGGGFGGFGGGSFGGGGASGSW